jgi:hypothetical protein
MNGFGELPVHGLAAAASSGSLAAEARLRSHRPAGRPGKESFRYAFGRRLVTAGSWVMGLNVEIPDPECAQPA